MLWPERKGLMDNRSTRGLKEGNIISIKAFTKNIQKSKQPKEHKEIKREPHWWEGKLPEDLARKADTVGGIKELDKVFAKVKDGTKKWEKIKLDLGIYRLRNGKIKVPESERSFIKVLEDVENRHYLQETLGKDLIQKLDNLSADLEKAKLLTKERVPIGKTLFNAGKREALDRILSSAQLPYELKQIVIEQLVPKKPTS